jgi:hypothetical protein
MVQKLLQIFTHVRSQYTLSIHIINDQEKDFITPTFATFATHINFVYNVLLLLIIQKLRIQILLVLSICLGP